MRNLQKNFKIIWQPPISRLIAPCCPNAPFLVKIFRPPPPLLISINFEKVYRRGEGAIELCEWRVLVKISKLYVSKFIGKIGHTLVADLAYVVIHQFKSVCQTL